MGSCHTRNNVRLQDGGGILHTQLISSCLSAAICCHGVFVRVVSRAENLRNLGYARPWIPYQSVNIHGLVASDTRGYPNKCQYLMAILELSATDYLFQKWVVAVLVVSSGIAGKIAGNIACNECYGDDDFSYIRMRYVNFYPFWTPHYSVFFIVVFIVEHNMRLSLLCKKILGWMSDFWRKSIHFCFFAI